MSGGTWGYELTIRSDDGHEYVVKVARIHWTRSQAERGLAQFLRYPRGRFESEIVAGRIYEEPSR